MVNIVNNLQRLLNSDILWFGKVKYLSLCLGHRFKPMFEFGFVTLDILYTYPEDSGMYECRATNAHGTDVTQATIKCRGQQSIIAETQLPGEGALRLQEMEENWRR